MTSAHTGTEELATAIEEGAEALLAAQRPDGVFDYGASSLRSTLATAGAITALHFADPGGAADLIAAGADRLRRTQNEDGGWAMVPGLPSEPGPTAVSAAALHLIYPAGNAEQVAAGRRWLDDYGGLAAIPHPEVVLWCRQFYGFVGWLAPSEMRRFPLELALLPGLYRRLFDLRLPMASALGLAQTRHRPLTRLQRRLAGWAEPKALLCIRQAFEHEGSAGSWSEDAWVTGLVCAGLARAGLAPDMVEAAVGWFRRTMHPDGSWASTPLDAAWTMYAARGLLEAGYRDHPGLAAARELFVRLQQHRPFLAFGCPPGFWGWSGPNGWPAVLETGEIISVLARSPGTGQEQAIAKGVAWLSDRQDSRGSWGLCVRDTKVANSGPCPMSTAQAVDALLDGGVPAEDKRIRRALRWLDRAQLPDGGYESVWYREHTMGTAAVLETFVRCGQTGSTAAVRARDWLLGARNADGSWGDGHGAPGTVEETGWAVSSLLAAGEREAAADGVRWLLAARLPGGGWTPHPVHEYVRRVSRYANPGFTHGMALRALGRFQAATR
ncbi:prenyltransferase/squalene oxidase repeat-containing protein [Crossiella sp. CA-258035]|uniref:prenyltransferase/squalene oxidase repeat-containing protein n=1 Tax=Crossiella sp. CA-258035 TaxID=2981138 RepID=UPI0024BC8B9C|nr:prenyltransferase/squalene oxidase repeat-containing protein [Crossiella sp. CA-258035]WHT16169.1 prenyltransferase/squalene oxidase repeat-containing protein [Crossiella sp. CA-258035]